MAIVFHCKYIVNFFFIIYFSYNINKKIFILYITNKMKTIINPLDNKRYSVFSKQGKQILKSYVSQIIGLKVFQEKLKELNKEKFLKQN